MSDLLVNYMSKRFKGFINTPVLWEDCFEENLNQLKLSFEDYNSKIDTAFNEKRLGKLVEQFVFAQLNAHPNIQKVIQNIQIIENKITLGELDCLFQYLNDYIHLEIVYKFYLYDELNGPLEIENWIGPNRKDSFKYKREKLLHKQLPILKHPKTLEILSSMSIKLEDIYSRVLFKAQLYIPLKLKGKVFRAINNNCIVGYYMGMNEFKNNTNCTFYMPVKLDWLIEPHVDVQWLSIAEFTPLLENEMMQFRSPLCWMKKTDGTIEKIFIVFWRD